MLCCNTLCHAYYVEATSTYHQSPDTIIQRISSVLYAVWCVILCFTPKGLHSGKIYAEDPEQLWCIVTCFCHVRHHPGMQH